MLALLDLTEPGSCGPEHWSILRCKAEHGETLHKMLLC